MRKVLTAAVTVALALVLVLGVTLPGLAAEDEAAPQAAHKPWPRILRGIVGEVDENQEFFTVEVRDRTVEIEVNEGTKFFTMTPPRRLRLLRPGGVEQLEGQEDVRLETRPNVRMKPRSIDRAPWLRGQRAPGNPALAPAEDQELAPNHLQSGLRRWIPGNWQRLLKWLRQFGQEATFDDIDPGDRVVVGIVPRNGNPLAKMVFIMGQAEQQRVVGTVSDIEEIDETSGTITIDTEDESIILAYDAHTTFVLRGTPSLKEGMKAVAIYVDTDDGLLAKRVMTRVLLPEPAE